jgi:ribonuclease VapC
VIIDSSALIAILTNEPEARIFTRAIKGAATRRVSAASYVEVAAVIDGRRDPILSSALDRLLSIMHTEVVPFTARQAELAREAYQRFGRGSGHPARLNLGDCFSYALARDLGEPLLFKGGDFALTDIELLVEPVKSRRLSEVLASYGAAPAG